MKINTYSKMNWKNYYGLKLLKHNKETLIIDHKTEKILFHSLKELSKEEEMLITMAYNCGRNFE